MKLSIYREEKYRQRILNLLKDSGAWSVEDLFAFFTRKQRSNVLLVIEHMHRNNELVMCGCDVHGNQLLRRTQ